MPKNAAGIAVGMGSKDVFTKAKRSAVMAAIRGRGNMATELRMMALFRAHGITGWRRHARDREVNRTLRKAGWRVVRVWECDLAKAALWPWVVRRLARARASCVRDATGDLCHGLSSWRFRVASRHEHRANCA